MPSLRKSTSHKRKPKRRNTKSKKERRKTSGKSQTKVTWEKFLRNKDSINALKKSWKSKNPEEYYKKTIKRLAKKYSNT